MKDSTIAVTTMAFLLLLPGLMTSCDLGVNKQELEISLAHIHEVHVNIAESYPPQVFVQIKFGIRDGCTTPHEPTIKRKGKTIDIKVTVQRPKERYCPYVYGTFEENVNLGTDFTSGETYIINVNDSTTSFIMQ
jgi:hypothetical protein